MFASPFRFVENPQPEPMLPPPPTRRSGMVWLAGGVLALAIGGVVWAVRRKSAKVPPTLPPPPPVPTPVPVPDEVDPWSEIDARSGPSTQIASEGDGTTVLGKIYTWRVYQAPADIGSTFSAVLLYEEADGIWRSWGDNPDVPLFRPTSSLEKALDLLVIWIDQH